MIFNQPDGDSRYPMASVDGGKLRRSMIARDDFMRMFQANIATKRMCSPLRRASADPQCRKLRTLCAGRQTELKSDCRRGEFIHYA